MLVVLHTSSPVVAGSDQANPSGAAIRLSSAGTRLGSASILRFASAAKQPSALLPRAVRPPAGLAASRRQLFLAGDLLCV